jgi:DNA-binding response OmpR family regulator
LSTEAKLIMVVEDEPDILATMKLALEESGFEVDAFNDPQRAVDGFIVSKYAMLVTDIKMSPIDGFELYRRIRKLDDKIKVAFVTAYEINKNEFGGLLADIDLTCLLRKPFRMKDLIERVLKETSEEITMS